MHLIQDRDLILITYNQLKPTIFTKSNFGLFFKKKVVHKEFEPIFKKIAPPILIQFLILI